MKREQVGRELRIALDLAEADHRDLARADRSSSIASSVLPLNPMRTFSNMLSCVLRQGLQPVQAILVALGVEVEVLLDVVAAREQRRRAAAQRALQLLDRDLVQVLVVDPQLCAVADDESARRASRIPSGTFRGARTAACRSPICTVLPFLSTHLWVKLARADWVCATKALSFSMLPAAWACEQTSTASIATDFALHSVCTVIGDR